MTEPITEVPGAPVPSTVVLGTAVQRALGAIVVLVVVGVLVAPRMSVNRYNVTAAAVGLVLVIAGWLVLAGLSPRRFRMSDRAWDATAAALCLLLTGIGGVFAYGGAYETTWDPYIVEATSAHSAGVDVVAHFSIYPNMRPFLAIARTVRSWNAETSADYAGVFGALNTVSLLVTAVALYLTVRRVAGPARGVLALVVLGAMLGTSPWLSVPYTDMVTLWVPIVAVALFAAAQRQGPLAGRAALAAAGGAVLGLGYAVKVTPVVGLAAFVLALAVTATGRGYRGRVRLPVLGGCAVVAFLAAVPAVGLWAGAADDLPPLRGEWAATPLTYVAEGLRTQTSMQGGTVLYGTFDRQVVEQTKRHDAATQNAVARRFITAQWTSRGLAGTLGFEVDKTLFNWGDGTFWARGEGLDAQAPPLRHDSVADAVMTWNSPAGHLFKRHVLLAQVAWTATLLAMGVGLVRSRFRQEYLLMALTIAGIAVFTLLFQGRSRYLLVHVPVVVALAAAAVPRPPAWRAPSRRRREAGAEPPVGDPASIATAPSARG